MIEAVPLHWWRIVVSRSQDDERGCKRIHDDFQDQRGRFKKGHPRIAGRERGVPNKITKTTKDPRAASTDILLIRALIKNTSPSGASMSTHISGL